MTGEFSITPENYIEQTRNATERTDEEWDSLICAAPRLLALLEEIRNWMDAEMGAWDAKFIAEIDAAIAQAKGETK